MNNYKIIGLMLTKDENEILEDWLSLFYTWFDRIFVLDGSDNNKSKKILNKYDLNYYNQKDFDIKITDHGLRKVPFEEIKKYIKKENEETDYWIELIHPDEFYQRGFSKSINRAYIENKNVIQVNNCHNFPHVSEIEKWNKFKTYKVFNHFVYPGFQENRIFKFNQNQYYDENTHSNILPYNLKKSILEYKMIVYHYKIITVEPKNYSTNGDVKNSSWSNLRKHYPDNHIFNKIEDFFLENPEGKYKNNKVIHRF
jgi:hypothetical protein